MRLVSSCEFEAQNVCRMLATLSTQFRSTAARVNIDLP